MTTFAELQQEVLDHQFSEARYGEFVLKQLHRAEDVICAQTDFRELQRTQTITTISGYPAYSLPPDFKRLYTVSRADSSFNETPLRRREQTQFDALPVQSGQPTDYLIFSNTLKLWPTPDDIYQVQFDYYAKPDPTADSPTIPEEYRHLLVDWALARCYARENDYNSGQYHQGVFDREVMKMRGEVQYDTSDYGQPRLVGDDSTVMEQDMSPRRP